MVLARAAAALWLCSGLGSGWVYNATIFTNSANFGLESRAKVIGLLATLFGAASTIWSTVLNGCIGGRPQPGSASLSALALGAAAVGPAGAEVSLLDAGSEGGEGAFRCLGGWVNGGIAQYFLLLAIALPSLALFGAATSFRITDPSERARADWAGGGDGSAAISRRLHLASSVVLALLATVVVTSAMDVAFDGEEAAVRIRMWAPLAVLALFAALILTTSVLRPAPAAEGTVPLLAGPVSCHDIAAIWVAFFSRSQQYRC